MILPFIWCDRFVQRWKFHWFWGVWSFHEKIEKLKNWGFGKNYIKVVSRKISLASRDPMPFHFRCVSFDPVGYWAVFVKMTQPFDLFVIFPTLAPKITKITKWKNGKLRIWQELHKGCFTKNLACVARPHAISFLLRLLRSCWVLSHFCKIDPAFWPDCDIPQPAPLKLRKSKNENWKTKDFARIT